MSRRGKRIAKYIARNKAKVEEELHNLRQLRKDHPAMFRICNKRLNIPCCQATTQDGVQCSREAMFGGKTYIKRFKCCYLCWQHAKVYGVYGVYKITKMALESQLSWEDYCYYYPQECNKMLKSVGYKTDYYA